jgi:hypothetical protein
MIDNINKWGERVLDKGSEIGFMIFAPAILIFLGWALVREWIQMSQ